MISRPALFSAINKNSLMQSRGKINGNKGLSDHFYTADRLNFPSFSPID